MVVFLFAAVITRTRLLKILDSVTIPGAAAFSVARVGCFLTGCCAGKETDLPWGVVFGGAAGSMPRHPSQLYEALLEGVVAAVVGMGVAGEVAATRMQPVDGNASFRTYLIDALYKMNGEALQAVARIQEA